MFVQTFNSNIMNIKILLLITGLFPIQAFAQNVDYSNLILQSVKSPPCQHDHCEKQCFSMVLKLAMDNFESLNPEAKTLVESASSRPQFSGTEQIATLGIYAFHYSLDGPRDESIDPTDNDLSGFPDYLEFMAFSFLEVSEEYHDVRGWTLPPYDGDDVNGAYYDVYIGNSFAGDNIYGFVAEDQQIGDNPNSPFKENDAATSYMVMRSDYLDFPGSQEKNIQVTAAHEYVHAIQYGYWTDMEIFMFEGTAAWAEEYMYPGLDDNFQYLNGVFEYSDVAQNLAPGEIPQLDGHWYSTWLFFKYLTEQHGVDIIKDIFEAGIQEYSYPAMNRVLTNRNDNLLNLYASYYIAAGLLTDRNNAGSFIFDRANDYKASTGGMLLESAFSFQGTPVYFHSAQDGNGLLMRTACDYHLFEADSDFRVDAVQGDGNGEIIFLLVKGAGQLPFVTDLEVEQLGVNGDQRLALVDDSEDWDWYQLLTLRADFESEESSSIQYEFQVSPLSGVAVEDISDQYDISVFPTVTENYLTIDFGDYDQSWVGQICDLNGKVIRRLDGHATFDAKELIASPYLIILKDEKGRIIHQSKFIKI